MRPPCSGPGFAGARSPNAIARTVLLALLLLYAASAAGNGGLYGLGHLFDCAASVDEDDAGGGRGVECTVSSGHALEKFAALAFHAALVE